MTATKTPSAVDDGDGRGPAPGPALARRRRRLRAHLLDPFSRNSSALVLNTVATGLLGLAFWFLAARAYRPADLGLGSALISAMHLLSAVVGINITGTLSRFLPRSGARTGRLVVLAYAVSSAVVAVLATGFVLTAGSWGDAFALLRDPWAALWFVAAAVAANVFAVQDGVLVGLRGAGWVALENTVFGVAKLVLLVAVAGTFPTSGVFLAWVVPMALLCLPVNSLLFRRVVPRHAAATADRADPPGAREIGRFLAGDFLGALFGFGAIYLVPVVVGTVLAPASFAAFYVAWMIAAVLALVSSNLAQTLTVEGVFDAGTLVGYARSALVRSVVLLGGAAVVVAVAAPWGLSLLGEGYGLAAPLLRLLALAAIARAVLEVWLGVLRAQGRSRAIARWQTVSGVAVVGAVVVGLRLDDGRLGLDVDPVTAVGILVLVAQAAVALAVLPPLVRFLRTGPGPAPATDAARDADEAGVVARPGGSARWRAIVGRVPAAWAIGAGAVLASVAVVAGLRRVDLAGLDGYGLVSVLPVVTLVGLAAMAGLFVATLALPRPRPVLLGAQLVALTVLLHGAAAIVESLPRFPMSYVHLGFVDYISRYGTTAPGVDARFAWPGFFAWVSLITDGARGDELMTLARWTPALSNLVYLGVLALALQAMRASWRARWYAALLFVLLQWVGQDYFSPQGFAFGLHLVFVAVLLTWFRPARTAPPAVPARTRRGRLARSWWAILRRWDALAGRARRAVLRLGRRRPRLGPRRPGETEPEPVSGPVRVVLAGLLVLVFLAATVSHQLTPFLMLTALGALVLTRTVVVRELPIALGAVLVGFVSYMTAAYWTGHIDDVLGGVGDVSGTVAVTVAARAGGGGIEHGVVVAVRMVLMAGVVALALVGLWRRHREGISERVAVALLAAPFVTVLVQSYGGEVGLRVYLFALPAAVLLGAYALFPEAADRVGGAARYLVAGVLAVVLTGTFLVAQYGNEAFESVRPGEMAAARYLHDRSGNVQVLFPTDTVVGGASVFSPLGWTDAVEVATRAMVAPRDPTDTAAVVARLAEFGGSTYFLTNTAEERYLEISAGYDAGWGTRFRAALGASAMLERVADTGDAQIYVLRTPEAAEPVLREPEPLGVRVGATPWTLPGAVALGALLIVLGVTEGRRLWRGTGGRWARWAVLLWLPLLAVVAVAVLERLDVLT